MQSIHNSVFLAVETLPQEMLYHIVHANIEHLRIYQIQSITSNALHIISSVVSEKKSLKGD